MEVLFVKIAHPVVDGDEEADGAESDGAGNAEGREQVVPDHLIELDGKGQSVRRQSDAEEGNGNKNETPQEVFVQNRTEQIIYDRVATRTEPLGAKRYIDTQIIF